MLERLKNFVKKKYDLYDKSEIYTALEQVVNDRVFNNTVSNKTTNESIEKFSKYLEKNNNG